MRASGNHYAKMKQLDYETIDIAKGETLEDILKDGIPTNTIFHKTLCGIGATFLELYRSKRNSIIVEPNLPVIHGKCLDDARSEERRVGKESRRRWTLEG